MNNRKAKLTIMIITTTPSVDGKTIKHYKGIVTGEAVIGVNVFRDLLAGLRDMFGGRSKTYQRGFAEGRAHALHDLEAAAEKLGADAVVAVDFDYEVLGQGNGMLMVSASGTAVVLE